MRVGKNEGMHASFWELSDSGEFVGALQVYLEGQRADDRLSMLGNSLLDVLNLDARIAMEGFADIFYQMLTAERCRSVQRTLDEMGRHSLALLFGEAFLIYTRGNWDVSEDDFASLDPFSLESDVGARFDEIGELFGSGASEIHRTPEVVHAFALSRRRELE